MNLRERCLAFLDKQGGCLHEDDYRDVDALEAFARQVHNEALERAAKEVESCESERKECFFIAIRALRHALVSE